MKTTLKLALLATVLMATPVLAADKDMNTDTNTKFNAQRTPMDANGKPMHRRMHHRKDMDHSTMNHDSNNPEYTNSRTYRDANGNMRRSNGEYVYNDYGNRTADGRWMGIDFNSRHMTDGADNDVNNRGRHAFIFGDTGSHVVKH